MLPIFIDIDGTLTDLPTKKGGNVLNDRIDLIKKLISEGHEVVIWSGGGTEYAKQFALLHGLDKVICIGKPSICVDDNPSIRPEERIKVLTPEYFFNLVQ